MRKRLPPHVNREKTRHDRWVYYFRVGKGKRVRLPEFGSDEFEPAYQAALRGEDVFVSGAPSINRQGSLRWLITEYKQSLHWRSLDPVTQRRRDSFFKQMADKSGDKPISAITERHIIDGRERRTTGKGHAANNFLKAVKPMFAYAKARGWTKTDPSKGVDFVKTLKGGRKAWGIEDVVRYEAKHPLGTTANLAMRILLFTGFRRSDAVIFGRQHIRNGIVQFRPGKTAKSSDVTVTFTALPPLVEAIEATKTGDLTFMITENGKPFKSGASFGNWFRERCEEAGVPARAHGLRKTGPTIAAECGATANELMAMWGWSTLAQAELYTRSADRKILGGSAAAKLYSGYNSLVQNENNIPRTFGEGAGIGEKE